MPYSESGIKTSLAHIRHVNRAFWHGFAAAMFHEEIGIHGNRIVSILEKANVEVPVKDISGGLDQHTGEIGVRRHEGF